MKMDKITVDWECPECGKENQVTVYPIIPAKIYGPPEQCHPEEGGDIEPDKCEGCGRSIPANTAHELAGEAARDAREYYLESKYEERRDERTEP